MGIAIFMPVFGHPEGQSLEDQSSTPRPVKVNLKPKLDEVESHARSLPG